MNKLTVTVPMTVTGWVQYAGCSHWNVPGVIVRVLQYVSAVDSIVGSGFWPEFDARSDK